MWGGAAALASAGFAFMATNAVAGSNAGTGPGVVSGYDISNVHYALVTNPLVPGGTYIQQVSFQVSPNNAAAGNVVAWFEDDGQYVSGYYSCTETDSTTGTWNCQNPNVLSENTLHGGTYAWAATGDASVLYVSAAQ
jgi:hypothetical protein